MKCERRVHNLSRGPRRDGSARMRACPNDAVATFVASHEHPQGAYETRDRLCRQHIDEAKALRPDGRVESLA